MTVTALRPKIREEDRLLIFMNVLIISLFTEDAWVSHQATELELAQKHLDSGDKVTFLVCDASIGSCTVNFNKDPLICSKCREMHQKGFSLLNGSYQKKFISDFLPDVMSDLKELVNKNVFDRESAEKFIYERYALGLGPVSTLIWTHRDPDFDKILDPSVLQSLTVSTVKTFIGVKNFLQQNSKFQRVYIFNGRFDITKGALSAASGWAGCDVYTHERGANVNKYALFENTIPHDRSYNYERAVSAWNSCEDVEKRDAYARRFYRLRIQGRDEGWKNFLDHQTPSALPKSFDRGVKNVVIFNSSEDEFAGLGPDWKNPIYESQSHGIERIIKDCLGELPGLAFYLRIHPNLEGVDNDDMRRINKLSEENLSNFSVISADSEIDSYALLSAADLIITFGSTIGIEATYHGKPSLLAGRSFYEDFDATYNAESHKDLMGLLSDDLKPKPLLGSMIYGYHYMTRGEDFKYWAANGFFDGFFKGKRLTETVYRENTVNAAEQLHTGKKVERALRPFFKSCKRTIAAIFRR